jgi:hypothetical protein
MYASRDSPTRVQSYCPQDRAGTDVQTHRKATKAPLTGTVGLTVPRTGLAQTCKRTGSPQDRGCGHVPNALRANRAYATRLGVVRRACVFLKLASFVQAMLAFEPRVPKPKCINVYFWGCYYHQHTPRSPKWTVSLTLISRIHAFQQ